jgi:acetyltransferase-like isoleucine patch superfamily enzyme
MPLSLKRALSETARAPASFMIKRYFPSILRANLRKMLPEILPDILPDILINQCLIFGDKTRLKIAPTAYVINTLFNLQSGNITSEDYVFCGHNVSLLTGTHDYHKVGLERQNAIPQVGRDITVKKGAWIASNAIILGPCVIGENAVISAGCIVDRDVPANTVCSSSNTLVIKEIKQLTK